MSAELQSPFHFACKPVLHFNQHLSLAFARGVDWVKHDEAASKGKLYKLAPAPQASPGGHFMSDPVVRAFVSYAHWSEDFVGQVGGKDYLNANNGPTDGVQMEVGW